MLSTPFLLIFLTVSNLGIIKGSDCPELWFDCGNGKCIAQFWICDKENDCGNFKDEENCDSGKPHTDCFKNQFQCTDGQCIPETWHCDGEHDCEDGSDERNCVNDTHCHGFQCKDNHCIPEKWKCDGNVDCADGSDEGDQCPNNRICSPTEFTCSSGSCIDLKKVCDGQKDCSDAGDEGRHCSDVCAEHTCSQKCRRTPKGPECYCNEGYMLDKDNKTCSDIDECLIEGTCSQKCTNLLGSYKCSCMEGYSLENKTCRAMGAEPLLIFSNKAEIRGYYLRTKRYFLVHKAINQASALDADPLDSRVYWIEPSNSSAVYSSKIDGSGLKKVLSNGLMIPEGIAVDYAARNLYFTDSGLKQILVCKMEGTMCHVLHSLSTKNKPRSIALDPAEGYLYWSDWGEDSSGIYRSGMDGSRPTTLVSKDIKWPNGITIDHSTNRLYWIDANFLTIEYVTLDGTQRKILLKDEIYHPYSLSVFEDNLYWSDWGTYSLETCNKFTSHKMTVLAREKDKHIFGVHVYHPVLARRYENPCWSNKCSHMCLIAPLEGYKCVCPPGFTLSSNGETCKMDDSHPVLIVNDESNVYQIKPEMVGSTAITELPITNMEKIGRIAYDWRMKTFYVADMKTPAIYSINISSLAKRELVKNHLVEPKDLAFDWRSRNLYWVDSSKGTVEVVSTRKNVRTSLIVDLAKPSAIALEPQMGQMFISTLGAEPAISMYNMDGSRRIDFTLGHVSAVALAVRPSASLLYWADSQSKSISFMDYRSPKSEPHVLLKSLGNVASVAVCDKYLYWTDTTNNVVNYLQHNSNVSHTIHLPGSRNQFSQRKVLFWATPIRSRFLDSACSLNNGGCSHLCLTTESGLTCACTTGMVLSKDGMTCTNKNCTSEEFQCKRTKQCVPKDFVCDEINDCDDGSDEVCDSGVTKNCPGNDFRCSNGRCIISNWKCDHRDDCGDNSDEIGCPPSTSCSKDQMSCSGGECIPTLWKCDGENDCTDGGDEKDCHATACDEETQLRCDHGQCIPKSWACDGTLDCNDGTDERNCSAKPVTCTFKEFQCNEGTCIDKKLVCDQRKDCKDGSDERNCTHSMRRCEVDKFSCKDGLCIYANEVCDRYKDCAGGEDEVNCTRTEAECTKEEHFCTNRSRCISRRWICDGDNDCGDESDEEPNFCMNKERFTSTFPPFKNMLACEEFFCEYSGECIPWTKVCDGNSDCGDLTDESQQCYIACRDNGGCSQKCTKTPTGSKCSCITGYKLMADKVTCEDINECEIPGYCSQRCNNTKGGFKCNCIEGYVLAHDHRKCKADGGVATLVYLLPDEIRGIQMSSNNLRVFYKEDGKNMRGMDYDAAESKFFWTDWQLSTLNSYAPNTNEKITLLTAPIRPHYLKFDWLTRTFFYTNDEGSIVACDESGKYCATTVLNAVAVINSFDISPKNGIMFWSVWDVIQSTPFGAIERTELDGSNRVAIVKDNIFWPYSITVDEITDRIYWADLKSYIVEVADFGGRQRKILLQGKMYSPMSMTVFEDNLFWADYNDTIYRCNKFSGKDCVPVHSDNVKAEVTMIFHKVKQPKGKNRCFGNKCPHLCVPNHLGYTCMCADGYELYNSSCSLIPTEMPTTAKPRNVTITCPPDYCKRNGRCVVVGNEPYCQCPPEYLGKTCERRAAAAGPEPSPDHSWIYIVVLAIIAIGLIVLTYLLCQKNREKLSRMSENVAVTFRKSGFGRKGSRLIVDGDDGGACDELMLGQADALKKPSRSFGNPLFGKTPRLYPDPESQNDGDFKRWPSYDSEDSAFVSESQTREGSQHGADSHPMNVKNFADRLGDFFSRN